MLRRATNLTVAERFQPCIVGEAVPGKSYRQLLFLCYKQNHFHPVDQIGLVARADSWLAEENAS